MLKKRNELTQCQLCQLFLNNLCMGSMVWICVCICLTKILTVRTMSMKLHQPWNKRLGKFELCIIVLNCMEFSNGPFASGKAQHLIEDSFDPFHTCNMYMMQPKKRFYFIRILFCFKFQFIFAFFFKYLIASTKDLMHLRIIFKIGWIFTGQAMMFVFCP